MREIVAKYAGECRKCGEEIEPGSRIVYERRVGTWCIGCAPTGTEEVREARQEAANRRADRLDGWAEKREERADAVLNPGPDHYSRDWAFVTQPGRIPARSRWVATVEREAKSVAKAREMRAKANNLRTGVRVKGDAEAKRQEYREGRRERLAKGQKVQTSFYGVCEVLRVNRKTARLRTSFGSEIRVDLNFIGLEVKE